MDVTRITTDFIENEILQWITEWVVDGLYDYVYHIVRKEDITEGEFFFTDSNGKIKCSFEHLLGKAIDCINPQREEDLILLAIKLEELDNLNIQYKKFHNKFSSPSVHILENVPTKAIHFSYSFKLIGSFEPLIDALSGYSFSLTYKGINFDGY